VAEIAGLTHEPSSANATSGEPFHDLGANYFDRRDVDRLSRRLVRRLDDLGYTVTFQPRVA
jgi:hypothetical protein